MVSPLVNVPLISLACLSTSPWANASMTSCFSNASVMEFEVAAADSFFPSCAATSTVYSPSLVTSSVFSVAPSIFLRPLYHW